jgi:hypothetical protein
MVRRRHHWEQFRDAGSGIWDSLYGGPVAHRRRSMRRSDGMDDVYAETCCVSPPRVGVVRLRVPDVAYPRNPRLHSGSARFRHNSSRIPGFRLLRAGLSDRTPALATNALSSNCNQRCLPGSSGGAPFDDNLLQRCFRDVFAARQDFVISLTVGKAS